MAKKMGKTKTNDPGRIKRGSKNMVTSQRAKKVRKTTTADLVKAQRIIMVRHLMVGIDHKS